MWRTCLSVALLIAVTSPARANAPKGDLPLITPKVAALAFVRSMENNDLETFQAVTLGGQEDYKLFEPLLNMLGAARDLERAAREKFGKEGRLVARHSPAAGLEVQVQESDVKVDGDTAILRHKGQEDSDPLTLKKTAQGWKVDLTAISDKQRLTAAAPGMRKLQQALGESAQDIRAGKFTSAQEAEQALLQRLAAMTREAQAGKN